MVKLDLSHAYPFVSLSFVLVLFLSALLFGEPLSWAKVAGVAARSSAASRSAARDDRPLASRGSASFARLAALEDRNYWFRSRNRLIVWALRRHFRGCAVTSRSGCGTGCVLGAVESAFPDAAALGGEMHAAGLEHAARRCGAPAAADGRGATSRSAATFDVVGCFDVLEHIADDAAVLAQCFLALRSGGGLILTVPQHPFLWSAADEYAGHVRRYRAAKSSKVAAAGFRPVLVTSFVSLLLPLMWAARARHRRVDDRYDPDAELNVGRAANACSAACWTSSGG